VDGTLDFCSDLGVDPEDVVLLAVACELQSPSVGRWKKASWMQGWRGLGYVSFLVPFLLSFPASSPFLILLIGSHPATGDDSVESFEGMKAVIPRLRKKLSADSEYFRRVYLYTFDFGRAEGQRSLPMEIALAFWGLLLPIGLKGGALRRQPVDCGACGGDDSSFMKVDGGGGGGWTEEHSQLWYDFLGEKNIKGVSKDTWAMVGVMLFPFPFPLPSSIPGMGTNIMWVKFLAFLRTIDAKFETYDMEGTFPHSARPVRALRTVFCFLYMLMSQTRSPPTLQPHGRRQ
jgi:DCN1-like protein 1/2